MHKHVNWDGGIGPIVALMAAEYEKCNIWPAYADETEYSEVLTEEICEALTCVEKLRYYADDNRAPSECDTQLIRPLAISAICELLQVVSVCDKWTGATGDET